MTFAFNLQPYVRSKKNTGTTHEVCFKIISSRCVCKYELVKRVLQYYPRAVIKKIHILKSLKKNLCVITLGKKLEEL